MTTLKCKICGGNIVLTGESHGVCDSCGNEVTLPRIDDDKRADMYNRGNHFRQLGDFDRAYSAYEHIIADNQSDAEAHWCLTLCRYGVEYVRDARTETYKPTVSRMSYERILDDPDYLAALAASDDYTKELYRRSARQIDDIQRRYLEISRKEQPYDVFICFKAEDENRQRTQANVLSQDIYEQLTAQGVKVFFSRITLESKLSEEYEPYIFAALHSAKVMLLVADSPEQLTARWVKNEWSRYLGMMDRDSSKHIIPVFVNMSPYDFPPEIPTVQGQDMSRLGAMQDLVRGVCKITGHLSPAPAAAAGGSVSVKNLLTRVRMAVESEEFEEADRILEDVLNRDAENGDAYYYRVLTKYKLKALPLEDCESLSRDQREALIDDRNFKWAIRFGNNQHLLELKEFMRRSYELSVYIKAQLTIKEGTQESYQETQKSLDALIANAKAENGGTLYYEDRLNQLRAQCEAGLRRLRQLAEENEQRLRRLEEENTRLQRDLETYREEIGNPQTFVRRTLGMLHAAERNELLSLKKKKAIAYYQTVIKPLEDEIIADVNKRWADKIGQEHLYPLADYYGFFPKTGLTSVNAPISGLLSSSGFISDLCAGAVQVQKGEKLAVICTYSSSGTAETAVTAPCDGWAFYEYGLEKKLGSNIKEGETLAWLVKD